ncbi:hypothetical protein BpHYR1_033834 [Brachionus plicatilis]|uniref:Uncharacterized protein n=1 Tax=Brachionus plicatilis TaxID=10195 RepID=A0A3M7PUR6_BRAPC|nr:hypothetical protein BpHYR1_033834 [Brachionus plicatilis]
MQTEDFYFQYVKLYISLFKSVAQLIAQLETVSSNCCYDFHIISIDILDKSNKNSTNKNFRRLSPFCKEREFFEIIKRDNFWIRHQLIKIKKLKIIFKWCDY